MYPLHRPSSWVIVELESGRALFETFNENLLPSLNTQKYKAVPIHEYLCKLNESIKIKGELLEMN